MNDAVAEEKREAHTRISVKRLIKGLAMKRRTDTAAKPLTLQSKTNLFDYE